MSEPDYMKLRDEEQLTITRLQVVIDAGFVPSPSDAHRQDLRDVLALVERLRLSALSLAADAAKDEDEAHKIGLDEGYQSAVQDIDMATGGDGEYRFCTDHDSGRHCPDAEAMKAKIVARFDALAADAGRYREALKDIVSPLAALRRDAEAQGLQLSGMANQIANSPSHLQSIARQALKGEA